MRRLAEGLSMRRTSGRFAGMTLRLRWIGLLACVVCLTSETHGQGLANGLVKVMGDGLGLRIDVYSWNNRDYSSEYLYGRLAGVGALSSASIHGPYDLKGFGGPGPRWSGDSKSEGNCQPRQEITTQHVEWEADLTHPEMDILLLPTTKSDSQASAGTETHWSASSSNSRVEHTFLVQRNEGGLADPPIFNAWLRSPKGAVQLTTLVEGHAKAEAMAKLSIVGSILDKGGPDGRTEFLKPITVFEHAIGQGADSWSSPAVDINYHLALPNWVRLSGAKFELTMGLQFEMFTYAEAGPVPEPASLLVLGVGAAAVGLRRRKKTR